MLPRVAFYIMKKNQKYYIRQACVLLHSYKVIPTEAHHRKLSVLCADIAKICNLEIKKKTTLYYNGIIKTFVDNKGKITNPIQEHSFGVKKLQSKTPAQKAYSVKDDNYRFMLINFWTEATSKTSMTILKRLTKLSKTRINKHKYDYKRLRAKKNKLHPDDVCIVCRGTPSCKHHIISLINGGDNDSMNLVPICNACHERIHSWMYEKRVLGQEIKDFNKAWENFD